jgi:hypothetical protein
MTAAWVTLRRDGGLWDEMVMNGEAIIARLRENEAALLARGVAHAALFGSRAQRCSDAGPDSASTS